MIAAQNGLEDGTRLLLDKNVDINAKDKSGLTALHYATKSGNEAIFELLLSRGSDRNVKGKLGRTAKYY
jgi:ankyrin repeat protein